MAEKFKVWAVAASFGKPEDGSVWFGTWFSPVPEQATAAIVAQFYQDTHSHLGLAGVCVRELTPEWLRAALEATERDVPPLTPTAKVLQVVPKEREPDPAPSDAQIPGPA